MYVKSIILLALIYSGIVLPVQKGIDTLDPIEEQEIVSVVPLREPEFIPVGPRPIGTPTPTPTPVPTPGITFAGSYYLVYRPDPQCTPSVQTITFPTDAKLECLQSKTKVALLAVTKRDHLDVGRNSPCWPFFNESYYNCLDLGMKAPMVAFGLSPHWTKGLRLNVPWEGCANGISGNPIFVNMVDPVNMLKLVSWETANYWLWKHMDRVDLTDGPYVSEVSNRAYLECSMVN